LARVSGVEAAFSELKDAFTKDEFGELQLPSPTLSIVALQQSSTAT
jgi:hypothetical protein